MGRMRGVDINDVSQGLVASMSSRFADMRGSKASPHAHLQQTCAHLTAYTSMMPRTIKVCSTCVHLQGQVGTCFL